MEFSFFFYSECSCKALYDETLELIKRISDDYICNNDVISSNPVQVWFDNDSYADKDDYVINEYGFKNNHELMFYVYRSDMETGIKLMFEIIDCIITESDVSEFVLQDPWGMWVMKSANGKKQLRDTDAFEYPFELLGCSSEFERCEAKKNG
ncbi:MAG: hypothetical protein IKR76_03970 [Ruminococcus sp.]|nr:hypothetical protein [Ruminococcus sp.]